MKINEITIIMPTWNSMPEIKDTLACFKNAFGRTHYNVIIIDKNSTDGTKEYAEQMGCEVITDTSTLGHARLVGLRAAQTKWVAFIDSDIVLPKYWFEKICMWITRDVGWVYGYTVEDIEFRERANEWKRQTQNKLPRKLKIGEFERAYTNNTVCLREPLLNAPIDRLNAWEDYVMGQWMIKKGYDVIEVPLACDHLKHGIYDRIGNYTEAWGIAGELKAKGWNPYTLMRPFYFVYWGVRCTIHFKDFQYFTYYVGVCLSMIKAILKTRKQCFNWKR